MQVLNRIVGFAHRPTVDSFLHFNMSWSSVTTMKSLDAKNPHSLTDGRSVAAIWMGVSQISMIHP